MALFASNVPSYTASSFLQNYGDLNLSEDSDDPESPKPTYTSVEDSTPETSPEEPPTKRPRPEQLRSLIDAVRAKDLKIVQLYLSDDINVNCSYSLSPLHVAVEVDDIPITQELLRHKFDINAEDFERRTPLHCAVNRGLRAMVRFLLNNGANANVHDKYGLTPIHTAVKNANNKAAKANDLRADGSSLTEDDAKRWNEHKFNVFYKVVQELVECHSVDINLPCTLGKTALYYSVVGVDVNYARRLVQLLLHFDADVNVMNVKGRTALSRAMTLCRTQIIEDLLKKGANTDVLINDANAKITPILWGISRNRADIVDLLLAYSTFNVNDPNLCPNHVSLLHYAADHAGVWAIRRLINAGADIRIRNAEGVTPFLLSPENDSSRVELNRKLFLEHMVVLESRNCYQLSNEELEFIYRDNHFQLELHHRKLQNEMLVLKVQKIPRTNITFYDFLVSSDHFASGLIQYPSVQKYCDVKVLKKLFPAFSRLMSDRFTAGKLRAELLNRTQAISNLRGVFFSLSNLTRSPYVIADCVDKILRFLNNRDLKHLLMAYERL